MAQKREFRVGDRVQHPDYRVRGTITKIRTLGNYPTLVVDWDDGRVTQHYSKDVDLRLASTSSIFPKCHQCGFKEDDVRIAFSFQKLMNEGWSFKTTESKTELWMCPTCTDELYTLDAAEKEEEEEESYDKNKIMKIGDFVLMPSIGFGSYSNKLGKIKGMTDYSIELDITGISRSYYANIGVFHQMKFCNKCEGWHKPKKK